jgi:anaerobic magnesium-protoporphyrin IX monomethyl ester cyclase
VSITLDLTKFDSKRFEGLDRLGIKVAFVQPKIPDGNYLPNLGIMVLSSLLLREGYTVKIFDQNLEDEIESKILAFCPNFVGFTCVTAALKTAASVASFVKEKLPMAVTMVGGPHVSAVPQETLRENSAFDFAIQGEAERSLLEFCNAYFLQKDEASWKKVAGLLFREGDLIKYNRPANFLESDVLDSLPFPAWHLLPMERIFEKVTHGLFSRGKRIMPVMTSRGCPNYCGFCCRVMGFKFRSQSLERVLAEIQWLYNEYKIDELYFEDDTFTQDPVRAHELLDGVISLKLPIWVKFANGLRADKVDEPLLLKMQKAGVYWVGFGIESGSLHTQKLMRKFLDLDLAAKNVQLAKRLGFKVGSNCIIGYPGETKDSIYESVNYFLRLKLDSLAVVTCVPFPGTTAWQECEKNSWFTERAKDYANYWFEVFKVAPLIQTPFLCAKDLSRAIFWVYIRFYFLNPKRAFLIFRVVIKRWFITGRLGVQNLVRVLRANTLSLLREGK